MTSHDTTGFKHRLHKILHSQHSSDRLAATFDFAMAGLILLNVLAIMLETVAAIYGEWKAWFAAFEMLSVGLFTAEYVARVWVANLTPVYQSWHGRIRYMLSPMALVDLAAILPSLLFMTSLDLRFLRVLRLFRIVRLLRLPRFNRAMHSLHVAVSSRREELLMSFAIMVTLLVVSSSLLYFAEHDAQPQAFSSIPASLWWGMVSLTTIGYGDIYPVTALGKVLAGLFSVLGIGFFALPSGILASALVEQATQKHRPDSCPHCGGKLDD